MRVIFSGDGSCLRTSCSRLCPLQCDSYPSLNMLVQNSAPLSTDQVLAKTQQAVRHFCCPLSSGRLCAKLAHVRACARRCPAAGAAGAVDDPRRAGGDGAAGGSPWAVPWHRPHTVRHPALRGPQILRLPKPKTTISQVCVRPHCSIRGVLKALIAKILPDTAVLVPAACFVPKHLALPCLLDVHGCLGLQGTSGMHQKQGHPFPRESQRDGPSVVLKHAAAFCLSFVPLVDMHPTLFPHRSRGVLGVPMCADSMTMGAEGLGSITCRSCRWASC